MFETPAFAEKRSDWEVAFLLDLSAGAGGQIGGWLMSFRNGTYYGSAENCAYTGEEYDFLFLAGGFGIGFGMGIERAVRELAKDLLKTAKGKSYQKFDSDRAWSADDLNWSVGQLQSISAGVLVVGRKKLKMSAWPLPNGDTYFSGQVFDSGTSLMQGSIGLSLTAGVWGTWIYLF